MRSTAEKRRLLRDRLHSGEFLCAPGIFEMISARLADRMGFEALYMTGYGTVASYLGEPDAGLASYADMVNRVASFCRATQTPIICDADTGYGGLLNVAHTVRGYEAAGAAAIQLEDQEFPKKCGHTPGRRVIPASEMVRKLKVAVEARADSGMLIIARTDSLSGLGLDEAIERGHRYAEAGADVLFIESPETIEQLQRIGASFDLPLLVNVVEGGHTPQLSPQAYHKLGFSLAIYPTAGFLATTQALACVYGAIGKGRGTLDVQDTLYPFADMCELMGFPAVWEFDRRYAE